jgi:hypothetical protein
MIYQRLRDAPELAKCQVTLEAFDHDDDDAMFPFLQYDTCRVWVRFGGYDANIQGVIQDGRLFYRISAYLNGSPWNPQFEAQHNQPDAVIDFIVGKFDPLRTPP